MKKIVLILALLQGCAVAVTPRPVTGSRADGTVVMSYEYGWLSVPEVDWISADREATQRCKAWNYQYAERFGAGIEQCSSYSDGTCVRYRVDTSYQCTGSSF